MTKKILPHQLLVKVEFSGVNRADLAQKAGKYSPPHGHSLELGLEIYGEIVELGSEVQDFKLGDKVFGLVNGGGYAKYCILESSLALLKRDYLLPEYCASIPEAYMTALYNLKIIANLAPEQTVLIHAGASSVGLAMIQVAKLLGSQVLATVRSLHKASICNKLGATTFVIDNYNLLLDKIKDYSNQVDVIIDSVGANYLEANLKLLKPGGKLINIAVMSGNKAPLNLGLLLVKNLTIIGSTLRNQSLRLKTELTTYIKELILPQIRAGQIQLIIDKIFLKSEVELAHKYLEDNKNIGKVLLKH